MRHKFNFNCGFKKLQLHLLNSNYFKKMIFDQRVYDTKDFRKKESAFKVNEGNFK